MKKQLEKDIKTLEALDATELAKEITQTEKELFLLNMKHRANELKQSHTLRVLKKHLATLHMIQSRL